MWPAFSVTCVKNICKKGNFSFTFAFKFFSNTLSIELSNLFENSSLSIFEITSFTEINSF